MDLLAQVRQKVYLLRQVANRPNQLQIAAFRHAVNMADDELTTIHNIVKFNNLDDDYYQLTDARLKFKNACRALSHACGLPFNG